jgi:NAD(P)-dependent dehydrogenase (short-subunit alcohol dehydrogenase family)
MRARGYGRIINISSIGGKLAAPLGGWYHASKFALEGFSDALRNEVRSFGIDVVVIEPGGIESEWANIAVEGARRYSAQGAYAGFVKSFSKMQGSYKQPGASVISDLVVKALKARHPKPRYHGGRLATQASIVVWVERNRELVPGKPSADAFVYFMDEPLTTAAVLLNFIAPSR